MNRIARLSLGIAVLLTIGGGIAVAGEGSATLLLGQRSAGEDAFDAAGVDGQRQLGVAVTLDFDWPVDLAIDLLSSSDDATRSFGTTMPLELDTDVEVLELDLGVRKSWREEGIRPYVGGGLAVVQLDAQQIESGMLGPGAPFSTVIVDDDDTAFGLWINGGFLYRVHERFSVGLDVRYSDAGATLALEQTTSDLDLDTGGIQAGLALAFNW